MKGGVTVLINNQVGVAYRPRVMSLIHQGGVVHGPTCYGKKEAWVIFGGVAMEQRPLMDNMCQFVVNCLNQSPPYGLF